MLRSSKAIKGFIVKVDETVKSLTLQITMNEVTHNVPMSYSIENGVISAKNQLF